MSGYVYMPFMHWKTAGPKEPGGETSEMRSTREGRGTQTTTKQYDVKPSDREGWTERDNFTNGEKRQKDHNG
jgi:hypothetical protein